MQCRRPLRATYSHVKTIRDTVAAGGHLRSAPGKSQRQSCGPKRTICAACGRHQGQSSALPREYFRLWKRLLEAESNITVSGPCLSAEPL